MCLLRKKIKHHSVQDILNLLESSNNAQSFAGLVVELENLNQKLPGESLDLLYGEFGLLERYPSKELYRFVTTDFALVLNGIGLTHSLADLEAFGRNVITRDTNRKTMQSCEKQLKKLAEEREERDLSDAEFDANYDETNQTQTDFNNAKRRADAAAAAIDMAYRRLRQKESLRDIGEAEKLATNIGDPDGYVDAEDAVNASIDVIYEGQDKMDGADTNKSPASNREKAREACHQKKLQKGSADDRASADESLQGEIN